MDYFGDLIYVIDMLLYKSRLMFMENGFWVKNKRRLTRKYVTEGKNKCTVDTGQKFKNSRPKAYFFKAYEKVRNPKVWSFLRAPEDFEGLRSQKN